MSVVDWGDSSQIVPLHKSCWGLGEHSLEGHSLEAHSLEEHSLEATEDLLSNPTPQQPIAPDLSNAGVSAAVPIDQQPVLQRLVVAECCPPPIFTQCAAPAPAPAGIAPDVVPDVAAAVAADAAADVAPAAAAAAARVAPEPSADELAQMVLRQA